MSHKLRRMVDFERQQLRRLLAEYRELLEKCATTPPNQVELAALAAMLHSFYTGVENVFKRAAETFEEQTGTGDRWHKDLLDSMAKPTKQRSALLTSELQSRLKVYMEFRHFFRHSYTFDFRWDRMKALVLGCEETLRQLEAELDSFFRSVE